MGQIINAERSRDFKCYASPDFVERRQVVEVSYNVGSYGMGGYGFLGLRLGPRKPRAAEWLVCTLFGADTWFTVGGRWVGAHPDQYAEQRPLHGYGYRYDDQGRGVPTGEDWDEFRPLVLNRELVTFRCEAKSCELVIGDTCLVIAEDDRKRPIFIGTGEPRHLEGDEDLRRAWIIAKAARLHF
jgi:hypothetical protein